MRRGENVSGKAFLLAVPELLSLPRKTIFLFLKLICRENSGIDGEMEREKGGNFHGRLNASASSFWWRRKEEERDKA